MIESDLQEPFHVTGGYLGQPGDRTFYLQAQDADQLVSLQCEKAQVDGLGDLLVRLLARIEEEPVTDWDRDAMDLREPVEPRWRVGTIGVGHDEDTGAFLLELTELVAEDDREPWEVRVRFDLDLARRLAAHCKEVVGEGRATCQLCGRPMRADGAHVCPRTNGHGRLSR